MLKIVNAFIKDHRKELGLKGYSKMSYLEKLKYLEGKVKGTKYEREIGKLTKPRVDEGIKKVLDKSGRGKNVRVKKEKKPVDKKLNKEMKSLHSKPKPKANTLDKDLFMDGLNIASTLGKSKGTLFELKANERITRYSPSFNLNRKNSKINKFLNKEGFVLDDKEGRRFYFQKRMTLSEAEDFVNKMKKFMKKDNPDLLGFDFNSDKNNLLNNFENADDGF